MDYMRRVRVLIPMAVFSLLRLPAQTTQIAATPELAVRGDISAPLILKADDLAKMPREPS